MQTFKKNKIYKIIHVKLFLWQFRLFIFCHDVRECALLILRKKTQKKNSTYGLLHWIVIGLLIALFNLQRTNGWYFETKIKWTKIVIRKRFCVYNEKMCLYALFAFLCVILSFPLSLFLILDIFCCFFYK